MTTAQEPPNGHLPQKGYPQDVLFAGKEVPPPCSAENSPELNQADLPTSGANSNRCQFTFADGRQCRNQQAQFCVHHASKKQRDSGAEGAPSRRNVYQQDELSPLKEVGLEGLCADLTTATNINRALAQVFLLMAEGRISQKQAVAFGYLTQLLLQTVSGVRAEYVSAFGYRSWEENLKSKLAIPPKSSFSDQTATPSDQPQRTSGRAQSPRDRVMSPDYGDLLSRSLDLLDRKYDTTPEGRREANALVGELELMNPPPAKPPREFLGRAIELVKRIRQQTPGAKSADPTRIGVPSSERERGISPMPSPTAPAISSVPSAPPAVSAPGNIPQAPAAENNRRPVSNYAIPAAQVETKITKNPVGVPTPNDPLCPPPGPAASVPETPSDQSGHRTDWYAPASWSGTPGHDSFPSRRDKFKRELRTTSNCRFRRLQHLQQAKSFPLE